MKPLNLTAGLQLLAGQSDRPRRFRILAYSGGMLRVDGFEFPVVLDLSGLSAGGNVPIILDHTADVEHTVGSTDSIVNNGQTLVMAGVVTGATPRVQQVLAQADSGHQWQASVGCSVEQQQEIPAGEVVNVNGQTFRGPVIVARKLVLRETSILPVGADSSTTVNLAAKLKAATQEGTPSMTPTTTLPTFEEWLATLGVDSTTLDDANRNALTLAFDAMQNPPDTTTTAANARINLQASANHQRIAAIERIAVGRPAIAATAIARGWSPLETENHVLKASQRMTSPSNHHSNGNAEPNAILEAAFLGHLGHDKLAEKTLGADVMQRGRELRCNSFTDIIKASFQLHGMPIPSSQNEMLRAGFSTMSLPGVLGNVSNKLLLDSYNAFPSVFRIVAKKLTASDFKTHTGYRLNASTTFEKLGPAGEIKHGTFTESSYPYAVDTFAKMFSLTRQSIVNDDLGSFESLPRQIGRGAAEAIESSAWTLVLANTATFFGTGNSNYISGGGSVLSSSSLASAVEKMLKQTDENGKPISVFPKYLVVPPELKATADELYVSRTVNTGGASTSDRVPNANPFFGLYQPLVTPYLSNATYSGYSTTAWFLFGDAADVPTFGIAYLNGVENPVVETEDADFSTLGVQFRGYLDFGVCQIDPRGGIKSAGA